MHLVQILSAEREEAKVRMVSAAATSQESSVVIAKKELGQFREKAKSRMMKEYTS